MVNFNNIDFIHGFSIVGAFVCILPVSLVTVKYKNDEEKKKGTLAILIFLYLLMIFCLVYGVYPIFEDLKDKRLDKMIR